MPLCRPCNRNFATLDSLQQHLSHSDAHKYPCDTCTRIFTTAHSRDQHMTAVYHGAYSCRECKRNFKNNNELRMHQNSRAHQGSSVACPFCRASFVGATGLSHHLESGSCPNARNVDRDAIHRSLRKRDPRGVIALPRKQLEWHRVNEVDEDAWNGDGYECPLCTTEFEEMEGLRRHLDSKAHKEKIYRCPNSECAKQFVALAALFNHLESESCGFATFERVKKGVGEFLTGKRLLKF
ncbi:putative zinc finger protein [Sphaerosporella brunnea]|uniref:Putative zinc finger protein n=1 Tax=Sphaerosporella brunnea TaxID=1250544 RepID=A0A5J5EJB9_9PEZI|nr:putative zinc finger protein [Sphaerosporella brunnea]